jgi:hypothetical protein
VLGWPLALRPYGCESVVPSDVEQRRPVRTAEIRRTLAERTRRTFLVVHSNSGAAGSVQVSILHDALARVGHP